MKKLLLSFAIFFAAVVSMSANTQKIKVLSDDGSILPFSYVYINGKPFGTADKEAETYIPTSMLKDGDFISASYVGYNTTSTEYIDPQPEYVITMSRSSLERVVVYSQQETRQEFRIIRHRAPLARASDFKFQFIFDINGEKFCEGDLYHQFNSSIEDAIRNKYSKNEITSVEAERDEDEEEPAQAFGPDVKITQTTNIHNRIYVEVPEEMEHLMADKNKLDTIQNKMIPILQDVYYTAARSVVTLPLYMEYCNIKARKVGESGRIREFMLSREGNGRTFDKVVSSIVQIDVDTLVNDIKESRMNITKRDGRLELTAKYGNYGYFRYPYLVEATYFMNDGTQYSMVIYNTRTTYADKPHVFRRRNSTNIWDIDNELMDAQASWLRLWVEENKAAENINDIQGAEYPTILYKELLEEVVANTKMNELLMRERLETIALVNAVWQ